MDRTKKRELVTGKISVTYALIYAFALGLSGLSILVVWTNNLTAALGIIGLFFYVVVYGYAKRKTVYGTLIGTISGSIPPVAGYVAVTNHLDWGAGWLFLILVFWQLAHFYSIAMYRRKDYQQASIPVLSVVKSSKVNRWAIVKSILMFAIACIGLSVAGYAGWWFAVVALSVSLGWIYLGYTNLKLKDDLWGKKMFLFSLLAILLTDISLALAGLSA